MTHRALLNVRLRRSNLRAIIGDGPILVRLYVGAQDPQCTHQYEHVLTVTSLPPPHALQMPEEEGPPRQGVGQDDWLDTPDVSQKARYDTVPLPHDRNFVARSRHIQIG